MEPIETLRSVGFVGVQFLKDMEKAWFQHEGAELREVKLLAWKPFANESTRMVLYKGPFAEIALEDGTILTRGVNTPVAENIANKIRSGPLAESFTFLK